MGKIEIELYGIDAPKTVANFVGLAAVSYTHLTLPTSDLV